MPVRARRRSFVDRSLFCIRPPCLPPDEQLPESLLPHVSRARRLQFLLDEAFPPVNSQSVDPPTPVSFQRAVRALDSPLVFLAAQLERGEAVVSQYARLTAEAQIPALLVDMLARMLHYRAMSNVPANAPVQETTFRNYVSIMRHPGAVRIVDAAIATLLRTMNALTASSELLSIRLAADNRLLPLLFDSIRSAYSVEIALALIEEVLHSSRRAADFDLSTISALPELIESLTPYQLGAFCRVLAPLVDERDVPFFGADHCSGACALSSVVPHHDWQQIQSSANQLRARRNYVGAKERVVRDRNHAVLLAIPGLLQKLVKLVAVTPAPREELALVDHALRNGVFTINFDVTDVTDSPQFNNRGALLDSIRAELVDGGEVVLHQVATAPEQGDGNPADAPSQLTTEEDVQQRVLLMLFRRLTGMDSQDAEQSGTDRWEVLDQRISRAVVDHSNGVRMNGIFRERRRRVDMGGMRLGDTTLDRPNGDFDGAPPEAGADARRGAHGTERDSTIVSDHTLEQVEANETDAATAASEPGNVPNTPTTWNDEGDVRLGPHMSINGLLMSSHQVEVLFVLYSLLIGRRKSEVQTALVDADIFAVLTRFCDALDWTETAGETRTEEAVKVHFIRLLHYMCDGLGGSFPVSRVELLFTDHERALLRSIEGGKIPKLQGFGSSLTVPMPPCSQEPDASGLQKLSLDTSSSTDSLTPSHCIRGEETNASHFQCCPLRPDNIPHVLGDKACSVHASFVETENSAGVEGASPRTSPSPKPVDRMYLSDHAKGHDAPAASQPGIICKIATILVGTSGHEEMESTRRYLLSGCVETFLRTASNSEKTLVAYQGLLVHLLRQLSESSNMSSQISHFRQTSFDLLGQLVKWNRDLFNCMNEIFRRDPKLLPLLLRAVSDRLIDSNVFVRSVVMSLERFRAEDELQLAGQRQDPSYVPYDFENCLLWEFVETCRVQLIHDLFSSVRVEDVNFENICCVNTTLILLVTSCPDEDSLDMMLEKVADMIIATVSSGRLLPQSLHSLEPVHIFVNFEKLVDFWVKYYQYQGLDVASQEISSNIHFDRLVSMATWLQERLPVLSGRVQVEAASIVLR